MPQSRTTSRPPRGALRRALFAVVAASFFVALLAPAASADRAFSQRFGQIARGDVRIAGNSVLSCPSSGATNGNSCFQARNGTGNILDNAAWTMANVDVDLDITTFNSSTADLTLPAGATVLYAGLYWGADTSAGGGGAAAPDAAARDDVRFKVPGGLSYSTVSAHTVDTDDATANRYQGVADVTTAVQGAGSGTYTVANVQAGTGQDRYGGWALVVAYSVAGNPVKWVGLYDGLDSIGSGSAGPSGTASATIGGFQAPAAGTVAADLGVVGWEGEIPHATGESLQVNGTAVGAGSRPTTNPYNASVTSLGSLVTSRNPSYTNNLGFDAGTVDADGRIPNGATNATVTFNSGLDLFLPGVLTLVADTTASAPVNTALPAISGTTQPGQTLTAGDGTWTGTPTITYSRQWQRCNGSGASCSNIAGATGTTYAVQTSDEGSTFRVVVTATNLVGSASATSNASAAVTDVPPANTALPTISGTTQDGQTLTAGNGSWSGGAPFTYTYQWRRCDSAGANCSNIAGATSQTYLLTPADIGATIRVVVSATNSGGTASATSGQTAAITAISLNNTAPPAISGTPRHGQTLSASNGTWTGSTPITYAYQWRRCDAAGANCADISGATSSTYVVQQADVTSPASTIRVVVTATNPGGSSSVSSSQTGSVTATPPVNTALPAITGTARHGQTLSATNGTWSGTLPMTFGYQWRRCDAAGSNCADIAGATSSTYVVQQADVTSPASTIRVVVTATNSGGNASATSGQTASVTATAPVNTALPAISGTPRHGQTLAASTGTWSGTTPITYAYQWRRCDAAGANCADISGATSSTYVAQQADVTSPASTLRVVVTATNSAGNAAATSGQTATVTATAPVNTALPSISGTAQQGQTLTAANGTWTGTTPMTFAYQWQRCDAAGANCSSIAGATGQTYVAQQADVAGTVRVVVFATNAAATVPATSGQTGSVAATGPVNTALPVISGTARHGQTLSTTNGTWSGTLPMTFGYQWRRCDSAGANCVNIAGATSSTYVAQQADVTSPASTLRVVVTAQNAGGSMPATSAQTSSVLPMAPANTALPVISGTARDGQTLTTTNGTWNGTTPMSFSYQWRRCDAAGASCLAIAGANSSSYVVQPADVTTPASTIRVTVTALNGAGASAALSNQTSNVTAAAPANTAAPAISGTPRHGQTLTASQGTWTGTPTITYAYQWRRCDAAGANCADISGATSSTYVAQQADVTSPASTLRVVVTATNAAGNASATSAQTTSVAPAAPTAGTLPSIAGTPRDGETLTAGNGTWSGTAPFTYAYQWRRCNAAGASCVNIGGATGQTYAVTPADVTDPASTIRVVVTATNAAGSASATSGPTAEVEANEPVNTAAPVVTGVREEGQTLSATTGTWTGTPTINYSYEWHRCDAAGMGCTLISGASGSTYVLRAADVGGTVRVVVTATNLGGGAMATSAAGAEIEPTEPVGTEAPSISGTPRDGETLSADPGEWSGSAPIGFTYQWRRCNSAGAACVDVPSATGDDYDLTPGDVGHTMRVVVTATNAAGATSATTAQTTQVVARPPVNTAAPTISGTTEDGATLTATTGTWTGTPTIDYDYQWQRCDTNGCADVFGATSATYGLTGADVHSTMRVVVTATNGGGSDDAASTQSGEVDPVAPVNTALPVVSGTLVDGETVSATDGTWTGTPTIDYDYQWQRCDAAGANCADIAGATGSTHALTPADVGGTVRVVVTASNEAGADDAASGASGTVGADAPASTGAPSISGTPRDGETLTADRGTWTGTPTIDYDYQWRRCDAAGANCVDIAGATGSTHDLTPADVGSTIRVVVTASNAGGDDSATSPATAEVEANAPVNTVPPAVSGTAREDEALSSTTGTWTGTPTIGYARQWQRCDAAGASCADISGATGTTYDVTAADVGKTIRIVVTATNAGGSDDASSSATATVDPAPPVILPPSAAAPGPSISGTARDGETLSVTTGTWGGTAPFSFDYTWVRCNAAGNGCSPIPGATASTYELTPADVGATIRVLVEASNSAGDDDATTAQTAVVTARPPVNTATPAVSGTTEDGSTLTATSGTWTGTPTIDYDYQWQRCDTNGCADVPGATSATYPLGLADIGRQMRVVVTASNAGGEVDEPSARTAAIAPEKPASSSAPTISGTPRDGLTLVAAPGDWDGSAPITHTYQWQRCDSNGANCADVPDAIGSAHILSPADVGRRMRVVVTGTNAGGSATGTSSATAPVAANAPANTVLPAVAGTYRDGSTLNSNVGTWTGTPAITYTRQWRRCDASGSNCTDIPGATGSSYELVPADVGKRVRLAVTATNAAGSVTAVSPNTGGVVGAIVPTRLTDPAISGDPKEGETLTATPGTWNGTQPIDHGYQWRRCDANGSNCVDIPGATDPTYRLTPGDVGHTIVVTVTATNGGGSSSSSSDETTKVVGLPGPPEPKPADPKPPVNDGRPAVSGDPKPGSILTADPGRWTPAPSGLGYQWERCDANGAACQPIPGATGGTYTPTDADDGSRIRVTVTATNGDGSRSASSEPTAVIRRAEPVGGNDLDTIGGSLVGPDKCTRIAAGTGVKRKSIREFGTVKVLLRASAYISPENPLRLSTSASKAGNLKAVRYLLDGRTMGQPKRKPYWQDIKPAALSVSGGDAHKVAVTLVPKRGPAVVWTFDVKTQPCTNLLSTTQWKTNGGTGLRLRVDSRGAIGPVSFKVPAAMLPKVGRDVGKGVGRVRIFTKAGPKPYTLKMTKPGKGVLLDLPGAPRVELVRGGAVVSGLPDGVGIVELTLYTQKGTNPRALLKKGKRATLGATTTSAGAPVRLSSVLVGSGR